jgi:hypothetical protein
MLIAFVGSTPFPPRGSQAGACTVVELGKGDRFFFPIGDGCEIDVNEKRMLALIKSRREILRGSVALALGGQTMLKKPKLVTAL